jgi:Protein of unknown function (DUF3634)
MPMLSWLLLAACLLLPIAYGLRRANELFVLGERNGKLSVLRGRLPPALFADLTDIAERWPLGASELHVVSESGTPRLFVKGPEQPALAQAARNVLGRFNVAQIRAGKRRAA